MNEGEVLEHAAEAAPEVARRKTLSSERLAELQAEAAVLAGRFAMGECGKPENKGLNFQPGKNEATEPQKKVCGRCPIIDECLSYAMIGKEAGIWGGATERQRNVMRKTLKSDVDLHREGAEAVVEFVRKNRSSFIRGTR